MDTYGRKRKKQSFDEEFAPEISSGYRQDVHKPPKNKNTSFLMGITIFAAVLLVLIIFVYF
ncbi:2-isopropylmalate synthase [Bacillus cereus]|nr:2-isopropylmalate synthase [Bacillus cereus]PGV96026.1 2-isopropylmalate synthase [Bacillus cereus]